MKIQPSEFIRQTRNYLANLNIRPKEQSKDEQNDLNDTVVYPPYNNTALFSVQTPQEKFIKLCKSMNFENYNSSDENIQKGIFQIDLHSHSNYSDGWADVRQLLDEVAQYADELYSKTGKNFTFALTDHDGVDGVKEALEYIKSDKDKFKHLNFIPGVELSFAFNCDDQVKSGEVLAYFIDPDSKEMDELVYKLRSNRSKMIDDFVARLGNGFSRSDMENYFINKDGETFAYNMHYRLRNYAQIKNRINLMSKEYNIDSRVMYKHLMNEYIFDGKKRKVQKPHVTPESFDEFLQENLYETKTPVIDENIDKICKEFYPKIKNGKVVSNTENSLEHIMEVLKDNDSILLGFAHPYFTARQMSDFKSGFDELIRIGQGKIVFSENYHQAYPKKLTDYSETRQYIDDIHGYLLSKGLIPIGGRDNHSPKFFNKY